MASVADTSVSGLQKLSKELDDVGYYSMLLTYDSVVSDNWIKTAKAIDENQKIKYMIAIRTYAISPEYCVMMSKGFNEISENRLILNVTSGNFQPHENPINNLIYINDQVDTREKRIAYTKKWIKKYKELYNELNIPEIVISGHSPETTDIAKNYADYHLTSYKHVGSFFHNKNIIAINIIVDNNINKIENFLNQYGYKKEFVLYGNEDMVYKKLVNILKENENTNIEFMFSGLLEDEKNWYKIHSITKKLINML